MEKLLLVDGHNLLFQMFFGMPSRILNHEGKAIQGTLGFVGALLKIIRMVNPTHVAVLFDGQHENARVAVNPDYKANRPDFSDVPEEENPFSQLPDIYRALDYMGIPHTETTECETDDWMAGYALTYGKDMEVVISSFDSDFFQLISDRVTILRYRGDNSILCTPAYIQEKFGILPCQYACFKSLVGDTADNIVGVSKVGPKTAAALLAQFGSLEELLTRYEEIEKPAIRAAVASSLDRLKDNYHIICLANQYPLPFTLDQLIKVPRTFTTKEVLGGIGLY